MADKQKTNVSMRVRIGDNELEVSGPSDFVEKKIADFLERQKKGATLPAGKAQTSSTQGQTASEKRLSLAQICRKIDPRTDVDKVLVAGYYLEKYEDFEKFTAAEIKENLRRAKIAPPKNTNDSINSNIKKGLMMSAGDKDKRRAFVLTSDGEETINDMLGQ
jgi:predicted metal-dependent hydrolase